MAGGKKVSKRGRIITSMLILGLVLLVGSGWAWWHNVRNQPNNIFWGMVNNSLETKSVTHISAQQEESQQSLQVGRLQTAPINITLGTNQIQQETEAGKTAVKTESIGTPFVDYVRYTQIDSTVKNSSGKVTDYSSVKNIWGKSTQSDSKDTAGQLYSQAVLGVIPFANLPAEQRNKVVSQMQKQGAYSFDAKKVKRSIKDKRPVYTYDITIKPVPYIAALKTLAQAVGLKQLDNVNPQDYASTPDSQFQLTIDVWSDQLLAVTQEGSGTVDAFDSYGLTSIDTSVPKDTTSIDDLQTKLQSLE